MDTILRTSYLRYDIFNQRTFDGIYNVDSVFDKNKKIKNKVYVNT